MPGIYVVGSVELREETSVPASYYGQMQVTLEEWVVTLQIPAYPADMKGGTTFAAWWDVTGATYTDLHGVAPTAPAKQTYAYFSRDICHPIPYNFISYPNDLRSQSDGQRATFSSYTNWITPTLDVGPFYLPVDADYLTYPYHGSYGYVFTYLENAAAINAIAAGGGGPFTLYVPRRIWVTSGGRDWWFTTQTETLSAFNLNLSYEVGEDETGDPDPRPSRTGDNVQTDTYRDGTTITAWSTDRADDKKEIWVAYNRGIVGNLGTGNGSNVGWTSYKFLVIPIGNRWSAGLLANGHYVVAVHNGSSAVVYRNLRLGMWEGWEDPVSVTAGEPRFWDSKVAMQQLVKSRAATDGPLENTSSDFWDDGYWANGYWAYRYWP